jgi:hypothetical protein
MKTEDGRRKTVFGPRSPVSLGRRLLRDTRGQVLLFGIIVVIVALIAFMMAIPNGTQAVTQKMRAQTAADAGAFTGSVWLARALNLNANMNIGVKSVYTWMTVLTMGEALAKALYSDTLDSSVRAMGQDVSSALFGSSNPVTVSYTEYPAAIGKLDTTAQWLYALQEDIAETFHDVAATLGSEEASRNAGEYPSSPTAGGWALVRTNDTIPLLVATHSGDTLMLHDVRALGDALLHLPIPDNNVRTAYGVIKIDSFFEIKAYYGDTTNWATLRQLVVGIPFEISQRYTYTGQPPFWARCTMHTHYKPPQRDPRADSFEQHNNGLPLKYLPHPTGWKYRETQFQQINNRADSTWTTKQHFYNITWPGWDSVRRVDTVLPPKDTTPDAKWWIKDSGYTMEKSYFTFDVITGAESTRGYQGAAVRPRRVNPDRVFHAVSYAWRQGAASAPYGLGPPMGGSLFPRNSVAAPSPMITVARSEPYLALSAPTEHDYFFATAWDAKLTPLDSIGVVEITGDTAYGDHSQGSFDNLEDLRKYVLLP